jgi:hypothetical protein
MIMMPWMHSEAYSLGHHTIPSGVSRFDLRMNTQGLEILKLIPKLDLVPITSLIRHSLEVFFGTTENGFAWIGAKGCQHGPG